MKNILITGGPTNEAVDEVMKITNMSTGSLSLSLADRALKKGDFVTLVINNSVLKSALFTQYGFDKENKKLKIVPVESTQDMYEALKNEATNPCDVVIHASAVGDYKPEFSFKMEDMAKELTNKLFNSDCLSEDEMEKLILSVLTNPDCKVNDDTKISSYEPHLTVKLTLTTKLIANLKTWFPKALLIGCKLLDNVTKEHLIEVAQKLCIKNNMDYILANDLAQLQRGEMVRYLVNSKGFTGQLLNAKDGISLLDFAEENWF